MTTTVETFTTHRLVSVESDTLIGAFETARDRVRSAFEAEGVAVTHVTGMPTAVGDGEITFTMEVTVAR